MSVRVTQAVTEALVKPDAPAIRTTQVATEALLQPDNRSLRLTETLVEVLVADNAPRFPFTANSRLKGASNKGGTKNTGTTTLTLDKPAGTLEADTLIAVISDNAGSNTTVTAPSGWNLVQARQVDGTTMGQAIYSYVVPANAPAQFSWTLTGSVNSAGVCNLLGDVGAVNAIATQLNSSSTSIVAPSINVTSENALLLFLSTVAANTSITPPAGMTEGPSSDQATAGVTTEIAFSNLTPTGATGIRTGTAANAGRNFGTLLAFEAVNIERFDFTADAVIMPTFTADALLISAPLESFFTGSLGAFDATPGHFVVGNADEPITGYEFTADAILQRTESATFTADALFSALVQQSFTGDAVLFKTTLASAIADAIIRRTESGSFTADAQFLYSAQQTFSANAVLLKEAIGSIIANSILRQTIDGSFTGDALLQLIVEEQFSANAVVLANIAASFTANGVILRGVTSDFTADALLLRLVESSFTADSLLLKLVSGSFNANSVILDTIEGAFSADARLYPRAESVRNPNLSPDAPPFIVIGDVPTHLAGQLPDVRLSPGGTNQVGQGKFVKRVKIV